MKIPKQITLGKKTYEIKKNSMFFFDKAVAGQIDYTNNRITLKTTLDTREEEGTFFHELAHRILKEMELSQYSYIKKQ